MAANGIKQQNHNGVVQPLLTDLYQITMAYAYWKSGKTNDNAVFDLYFRKNPFDGEFTIFAGLDECLKFLNNFRYSDTDIAYLKETLPESIENDFFDYLKDLTAKDVTLHAIPEGSVVFPRVPIIKIEGPLIIAQLLETTLLTLVNYASLMATNAARYRMVAGRNVKLLEFGLRRAQGPDGGLSASKYAYIGGFDGTSNVLAGKLFNIPVKGTHAHAYITSFSGVEELKHVNLRHKTTGTVRNLLELAIGYRQQLSGLLEVSPDESNDGELAAMVSFAIAFPDGFMALVDTYDVKSNQMDTLDHNRINHSKSIEFNKIVHDTMKKLNNNDMHNKTTLHNNIIINNSSRCISSSGSDSGSSNQRNSNETKDDVQNNSSEVNYNNNINSNNAKDHSNAYQNGSRTGVKVDKIQQNGSTTNGYVNGHSNHNRCTIVQNFQNYHKPNRSGLLNFSAVAMALNDQGYRAVGIRIDSGDLAYLSCLARDTFDLVSGRFNIPWFKSLTIVASNDINEETILSLNEQGHKIDCFGIGTHLVTCQRQPALGCVYKLVEINGNPRTKLSEDMEKATMPGNKNVYRLYSLDGHALIDLLQKNDEPAPVVGQRVLCRHALQESKRAYVTPSTVEPLYKVYWQNGEILQALPTLEEIREKVQSSLRSLRNDHKRTLNPTPYKVSVSDELYSFIHNLWLDNQPILELS